MRPALVALSVGDAPERWEALGFAVTDGGLSLGGVRIELGQPGEGITGWSISGIPPDTELDGLATRSVPAPAAHPAEAHPNGAISLDHVVVVTPDFERTAAALTAAEIPLRRIREAAGFRQGFRRLGPAIMEVVESPAVPSGPARFWGLVVVVDELDALAERLGSHLGQARPAVQPGRRIATLAKGGGALPAGGVHDA